MQQGSYAGTLDGPRSIIAVFDDWLDLQVALEPMSARNGCGYCVVIHARKGHTLIFPALLMRS